jgi:hypothetical protein
LSEERESVKVLRECIELQLAKSQDYQNPNSNVVQADHYRRGIDTIFDTMNGKMLRIQSLLEASAAGVKPKHESIEDSLKDLINYASFGVSWLRGKMEGQKPDRDMFNRCIVASNTPSLTGYEGLMGQAQPTVAFCPIDKTDEWDFRIPSVSR